MAKVKFHHKQVDPETIWQEWFSTSAYQVEKRLRHIFQLLPHDPRCQFCNAPFEGAGSTAVRLMFGIQRSTLNPRFCNVCDDVARKFPGGAEVAMAMLFADVRGSTALAQQMSPMAFSQLINRFYTEATRVIIQEDGLVEKLAGDAVAAFWGAGFAGPQYVRRAVEVARTLQRVMVREAIPVGVAVHYGVAYFGTVGAADGLTCISAIGDEVNLAARLASRADAGEILISELALRQANLDGSGLELRCLELKGIRVPCTVRVMHEPTGVVT